MLTPSELSKALGEATAKALMRLWGGHRIPRLTGLRVSRETRNAQVRQMYDATHGDLDAIALHFDLTSRHVQRIVNGEARTRPSR